MGCSFAGLSLSGVTLSASPASELGSRVRRRDDTVAALVPKCRTVGLTPNVRRRVSTATIVRFTIRGSVEGTRCGRR